MRDTAQAIAELIYEYRYSGEAPDPELGRRVLDLLSASPDRNFTGDKMQSSLSRLSDYILTSGWDDTPYEVRMAAIEAAASVKEWTEIRKSDARVTTE